MLSVSRLSKQYPAHPPIVVLEDVSLDVRPGETVAIMGPSGTGKSTLLYALGALEPPTAGTVRLGNVDPYALDESAQAAFRGTHVGFVFQDHLLLPQLTALDNVLVPTLAAGLTESANVFETRARSLLEAVGLSDRLGHRPSELSGGERQRVAVARALIRQPSVLLCDEPTGNLDRAAADVVAEVIIAMQKAKRLILVAVTHSPAFAVRFQRRYELRDRRLVPTR